MTTETNATASAPKTGQRGFRKVREGYVVSDKMNKTVTVEVEDRVQHPLYGKTIRRTKKVKAHDEQNSAGVGDRRSEEHTSELQSLRHLVCRLLLEKKNN